MNIKSLWWRSAAAALAAAALSMGCDGRTCLTRLAGGDCAAAAAEAEPGESGGISNAPEDGGSRPRLFRDEGVTMQPADFPEEYRSGVTLVYFTKPGCPACAKQDPVYEEVVRNLPSPARAYQIYEHMVNLDYYKVTDLPTLIVFRDGKEYKRFTGITAGKKLLSAVHSAL